MVNATRSKHPVAVDLFAGAGGLSEGLLAAGLQVACSVELHPQPALTCAFNHSDTAVLVGDVRRVELALIDELVPKSGADLVVGGPPCQGFSSAGKKQFSDPRNSLFQGFIRVIEHMRPRMFLMENVPGFKSMYSGKVHEEARRAFTELGYITTDTVLRAADYGVPQRRKRFVMVGWIPGLALPFHWPSPLHAVGERTLFDFPTPISAEGALEDIAFLQPGFEATRHHVHENAASDFGRERRGGTELLFNHLATRHRARAVAMFEQMPEGGSIRSVDPLIRSGKVTMSRIDRSKVSNTVLSLPDDMIHYAHHRILTVREMARLQTFDDDFVFFGKRTSGFVERRVDVPQYTQVGNAVPPLLGRALGVALLQSLGSPPVDLRNIETRRARHKMVRGSSGYAGYLLDGAAAGCIKLRTVEGEDILLPLSSDEPLVVDMPALRDWTRAKRPRRGQWAPGIVGKNLPSWMVPPDVIDDEVTSGDTESTAQAV